MRLRRVGSSPCDLEQAFSDETAHDASTEGSQLILRQCGLIKRVYCLRQVLKFLQKLIQCHPMFFIELRIWKIALKLLIDVLSAMKP